MEKFQIIAKKHFYLSFAFFALGLFFGLIYSLNLLGFVVESKIFNPDNMRAIHISLMLYGFIPLMLSYLPYMLIAKDLGFDAKAVRWLEVYTLFWYVFLVAMLISLLMGVRRGLAFYDFHYGLNGILALAGVFYIIGLYRYIALYKKKPLWIKVSLIFIAISPFALLVLMNPEIGQVEATISGPHGDNTLGMSLALIPIYYLIIKYLCIKPFPARWNILWIIPTIFYALSVGHRVFIGPLTYSQEWFFQWLTLLYVPLLYRWYKDADITKTSKRLLLISILAFLFVDIEGNLLFVESIRWVFHRNDLVIAHAHVAMGIGVLFMTLSLYGDMIDELMQNGFVRLYLLGILGIFVVLSLSGFMEAGYLEGVSLETFWSLRSIFGFVTLLSVFYFVHVRIKPTLLQSYNLIGVLADGLGGIFLFLFADALYPFLGFSFAGVYEYAVFAFVMSTGIIHLLALLMPQNASVMTALSATVRVLVGSVFLSLFLSQRLDSEALGIFTFDYLFASIYIIFFYNKEKYYATI